jgi:GNAT superfamily N-acetyltransferase
VIRLMEERDLPEAKRILRLAFGTYAGAPDPENRRADIDFIEPRWRADATRAFVAEVDGKLVGSNLATRWGSFGFFGPLTVHPDYWNRGIAQKLLAPVMECFEKWQLKHAGLFTFAESAKHAFLYQKYGFWPRFLTTVLTKEVRSPATNRRWSRFSELSAAEQESALSSCDRLTDAVYPGLNVECEIRAVQAQSIGDTILSWDGSELVAFAVCHCGANTEAGENKCYVKFGAAQPGTSASLYFDQLLNACETFAASRGLVYLDIGMNLSHHEAYRTLLDRGFRTMYQGVAMHRPNESGFSRPGLYVINDWR